MKYPIIIINQPIYSDDRFIVVSNYEMELTYEIVNTSLPDFDRQPGDIGVWRIKKYKKR